MTWKRVLRPTNGRIRLAVGLLLAALFCIQCTRSDAVRGSSLVAAVTDQTAGDPAEQVRKLEQLAQTDHIALLEVVLKEYDRSIESYTCTFIKQERINGQLLPEQWMDVKFKEKPFSIVMCWTKNSPPGDRALYVEGKYNGKMIVRPYGWLAQKLAGPTVTRDPESKEIMANTLRPITMFGLRNAAQKLLETYELARDRGEAVNRFVGYRDVAGRRAMVLERVLPPSQDYPAKTTTWYLDVERLIILGLEGTDWDDQVLCSYFYKDVKLNPGLADKDFTPAANDMVYNPK